MTYMLRSCMIPHHCPRRGRQGCLKNDNSHDVRRGANGQPRDAACLFIAASCADTSGQTVPAIYDLSPAVLWTVVIFRQKICMAQHIAQYQQTSYSIWRNREPSALSLCYRQAIGARRVEPLYMFGEGSYMFAREASEGFIYRRREHTRGSSCCTSVKEGESGNCGTNIVDVLAQ